MSLSTSAVNWNDTVLKSSGISRDEGVFRGGRVSGNGNPARTESTGEDFRTVLQNVYRSEATSMDAIFEDAAACYDIPVDLLKAVAKTESNFNTQAVSKAGAMGVMQLMPSTARSLGVSDPFDARQNIMAGARCLKGNLDRFGGNVSLALAAYNAGAGSVQKYGGIPPYKETQNFVKKVLGYMGGSPIYTGKMVYQNSGSDVLSQISGNFYGNVSDLMLGMYSSYGSSGVSGLMSAMSSDDLLGNSNSLLSGLYGGSSGSTLSSLDSLGLLSGSSQGSFSSLLSGSGSGSLSSLLSGDSRGLMGSLYGQGSSASLSEILDLLTSAASDDSVSEDEYAGMVQLLRMKMMMNASRQVGSL